MNLFSLVSIDNISLYISEGIQYTYIHVTVRNAIHTLINVWYSHLHAIKMTRPFYNKLYYKKEK